MSRLDRAIDAAVREMLEAEPRADLRARVMARLPAAGTPRPAAGFLPPSRPSRVASAFRRSRWVLASALVAAMILLAIAVMRRGEPLPQAPVVAVQGLDRQLPAAVVETRIATPHPTRASIAASARAPRVGVSVAAASLDEGADAGVAIDPLSSIAPIAIAPIRQHTIAPADIAMRSLNPIQDVEIAPLTPPSRR